VANQAWGGRFTGETDRRVALFTESISFDHKLFEHDIRGSIAHARMLAHVGILTDAECDQIVHGLSEIRAEIAAGTFPFEVEREDIHMHVEAALIARLGDVGRKLHTARSRNDQVATDLKLWVRDALDRLDARALDLQRAWLDFAARHRDVILPGYTHLQRAQPVLAAHYALAYVEKLQRDRGRLADCRRRLNTLPLGAAALAGTSLPIDRHHVARALGFDSVAANSLDVSSDRDFALEAAFACSLIALHLAGWAEEWVLWSTQEFGFLDLPDAVCTGSSIMPQKKNPDVCELVRGKSARVVADVTHLLVLVKGLPLAYNRDLQEDKRPVFDACETAESCLELAAVVVSGARLRADSIAAGLDRGYLDATTLMERLIARGIPQRTAHELVGKLVAKAESREARLVDLTDDELHAVHPDLGPWVRDALGVHNSVAAFGSYGSTAPAEVDGQLRAWMERLDVTASRPSFPFQVGLAYERQKDIHDRFGGNRQSGIAACSEHPYVFLFSSPRGEAFGYRDGWISDETFLYTGEGQEGDMEMQRGNLAIRRHEDDGRELHLFERRDDGRYEYKGEMRYVSHEMKRGVDGRGRERSLIQFRLGCVASQAARD
jgi:argininosuccinate lyase